MNYKLINFLTNLKKYSQLRKEYLLTVYSSFAAKLLNLLYKEGYIQSYKTIKINETVYFYIILRYYFDKPIFKNFKIISTSSKFKFLKFRFLINLYEKKINFIVSTTKGLLTLKECKKNKIGGKVLFCC
jgi:small subunit ribosomal protein S8